VTAAVAKIAKEEMSKAGTATITAADAAAQVTAQMNNLQVAIGDRLNQSMGPFLSSLGSTVGFFTDLVAIPLSDKYEDEAAAVAGLTVELTSADTAMERRRDILNYLNSKYPGYLENMDLEKTSMRDLAAATAKLNGELINRIVIQRQQEKIDKANEKVATKAESLAQSRIKLAAAVAKLEGDLNIKKTEGLTLEDRAQNAMAISIDNAKKYRKATSGMFAQHNDVRAYYNAVVAGERNLQFEQDKVNNAIADRNAVMKELGITEEKANNLIKQGAAVTADQTESTNASTEAKRKDVDELGRSYDAMHDLKLAVEGLFDTIAKEGTLDEGLEIKNLVSSLKEGEKAAKKMKEMAEKMEEMSMKMESEQNQENIDDLRAILENLIKLSFDQEELMKEFRGVNLSDPRFIKLAQNQLKIKDDSKIVEDSLYALAKRVFQIQSFVTKELGSMKKYINESTEYIKQRRISNVIGKQQMTMTSMNNLALMLSESLNQMQQEMQSSGGKGGKKQKKNQKDAKGKGKKKGNQPNISKLQKQLGEQIKKLQESGKSGKELSQELAKLAAEQQRLRQALRELEKMNNNGNEGKDGKDGKNSKRELSKQINELKEQMEKIEEDLVNKNLRKISQERLKEIETRLLESEKALKERGEEEERKGETGKEKNKNIPPALQKYFKNKEKQTELLKTIPPSLSPYYKKQVDEYFKKIK
jgi:hypothetical protein